MAQQLKRWESPRRKGRNDKGRGGTARQRQLAKRNQVLRKRLKDSKSARDSKTRDNDRGEHCLPSFLLSSLLSACISR
jgi:hypothetical protein